MGFIYQIKNNINGKVYIGQTSRDPFERAKDHFLNSELKLDTKLSIAILKYGLGVWSISVIEECDNSKLSEREIFWINALDSFKNGYNSTLGGEGKALYNFDEEGIIADFTNDKSIRKIAKEYGCVSRQISRVLKSNGLDTLKNASKNITILAFDKNYKLIAQFDSKLKIQKYLIDNCNCGNTLANVVTRINKACKEHVMVYGLYWIYANDIDELNRINKLKKDQEQYNKPLSKSMNKCPVCGRELTTNGKCKSCVQIEALGFVNKPSKEDLLKMLNSGMKLKEIAKIYNRSSNSTIAYWIKSYGIKKDKITKLYVAD